MAKTEIILGEAGGSQTYYDDTLTSLGSGKITVGFRPKKICIYAKFGSTTNVMGLDYNADDNASQSNRYYSGTKNTYSFPYTSNDTAISNVDDTGFYMSSGTTLNGRIVISVIG